MKIAYVQAFYLPAIDGPATVIHEIASRLAKRGHEVHVFCSDSDKHGKISQKEELLDGVKIHRLNNWFQIGFATFFPAVFFKLMKGDFDIIHSHVSGHSYHFFSSLVRMIKKTPHVHTTHCCWTSGLGRSKLSAFLVWLDYRTVLPFSFHYSDKIIAITPWELDEIAKYNSNKNKVTVIPNGMDSVLLKKIDNNDFRKTYGIPEDVKLVLYFGRLNPTKGADKLAETASEITKTRKDIHFAFVGPDEGLLDTVKRISEGNPNVHILGVIRGKDRIAEMFQASDLYALPSYREGLPLCLPPNTLIQTNKGLKEISKIKINDNVLTHKNRFCKVIKIIKRDINEEIVCIKPYGINQEIEITKEHPVLAIKRPKKRFHKSIGRIITENKPSWIKSQDLSGGDCVVFPILKYESKLKNFDLINFDKSLEYSSNKVWYKYGFSGKRKNSYVTLMKNTGETKKVIEMAINYLKTGELPPKSRRINKILSILKRNNFCIAETKKYPRFIRIDNELAYVFGWYIAEGSTGKGFIRFALHKKEIKYAKKISRIINKKFGISSHISIKKNTLHLVFCGKILESLFSKLCGKGAENKKIPMELFNKKLLPHVIKGLFLGDGYFNKAGWTLSTASRQLANDVILALLKLKKKFNFHKPPKRDIYVITYQPNNPGICHSNKSWFVGDNLCFMIRTIKRKKYQGAVYNLEVKDDNSYTTSAFCVHNCLFEAMASGLPIVASPVNGIPYEMKEPENGLFVQYGDIDGLKKSILKILDDPKLAKEMRANNLEKAKAYDWDIIAAKTLKVYESLLP